LHDKVELIGGLESISQSDQEGVIDVLQNHFFRLGVLDLVFFDDVVLVDWLHGEELSGIFLFNQQDSPKRSLSEHNFGHEVIDRYLFLEVVSRVEGLGGFPDHLFFLLFAIQVLLEGYIIVHGVFAFHIFGTLFLFFLFGGGIVHQIQLISEVDGQFIAACFSDCPEDAENDLVPSICGGVSESGQ
jgi:hypothetical protein